MTLNKPSPPEIAAGTHFHVCHGTNNITPVFLLPDREAFSPLLPSLVSLLLGGTAQQENIYLCILKVKGQL